MGSSPRVHGGPQPYEPLTVLHPYKPLIVLHPYKPLTVLQPYNPLSQYLSQYEYHGQYPSYTLDSEDIVDAVVNASRTL